MKRKVYHVLSAVFFGVFTAPIVSAVWFAVPWLWLKEFPVGADSPHTIGLPVGFCIGVGLAIGLNKRRYRWGRGGAVAGAILLGVSGTCGLVAYAKMREIVGWDGLGWLVASLGCLYAAVSALGLTLAGVFSHLSCRNRFPRNPARNL